MVNIQHLKHLNLLDYFLHNFLLHGFLCLQKGANGEWLFNEAKYEPILNLSKDNETIAWNKLQEILANYSHWPILHYGETELLSINKLANRQGEGIETIKHITERFVDIHARLKNGWLLPVKSYSLKEVAKWLSFKWSKKRVTGANALLWWRQWKNLIDFENKKSNQLKWILEYNKDDCIATWKIAEWIKDKDIKSLKIKME